MLLSIPATLKIIGAGTVASLIADVANPPASVSTWVTSVGSGVALSALAYVAKQFASGNLISRSSKEVENRLEAIVLDMKRIVQEARDTEKNYIALVVSLRAERSEMQTALYAALARERSAKQ